MSIYAHTCILSPEIYKETYISYVFKTSQDPLLSWCVQLIRLMILVLYSINKMAISTDIPKSFNKNPTFFMIKIQHTMIKGSSKLGNIT